MTPTTPSPISDQAAGSPVAWAATSESGKVEALSFNQSRRFDTPLYFCSTAPTTGSAPEMIRFDFINADGNEDSKVISHDEMRERYADMHHSANSAFAAPTQGADAQFIAEHGHRLAELLKLDYYDIADRDAQITMLLANKLPQPSQGADARPVAIYQVNTIGWVDVTKESYDASGRVKRIVYATRDAEASDGISDDDLFEMSCDFIQRQKLNSHISVEEVLYFVREVIAAIAPRGKTE